MMQPPFRLIPLATALAVLSAPVNAGVLEDASETLTLRQLENVNYHRFRGYDAAALPDGGFALIWAEDYRYNDYKDSVILQRFDASGNASGEALTLFQTDIDQATNHFRHPAVAADEDGDLVVAWSTPGDHCYGDLFVQTLDGDGDWSNLPAPTLVSAKGCEPRLAMDADGDFALTWRDRTGLRYQDTNSLLRTYSANGIELQNEPIRLVQEEANFAPTPVLAMQPDGEFMVAWQQDDSDFLFAQRFNIDGNTLDSTPKRLDNGALRDENSRQLTPALSTYGDDGYIAFWSERTTYTAPNVEAVEIRGLRWHADGTPGRELTAGDGYNTSFLSYENITTPTVSVDSAGNVLVAWRSKVFDSLPDTKLTVFDDRLNIAELEQPYVNPSEFNDSDTRFNFGAKLVMSNDRGILIWARHDQDDGQSKRLLGRILPTLIEAKEPVEEEPVEEAPIEENSSDDTSNDAEVPNDNGGGGSSGGAGGPWLLSLLALLGIRRWMHTS
ncbi:MAG TPA: hypothetical protein VFN16_03920 [Saccharospirillum sp.]|nr:hypothetical protein [Saccharospirillum sp.]